MGTSGEKARLAEMALKGFAAEAGNAVKAAPQLIKALQAMPDIAERSALAIQLFGDAMGPSLIQSMRSGQGAIDQFIESSQGLSQQQIDAANRVSISMVRLKAAFQTLLEIKPGGGTLTVLDMITRAVEGLIHLFPRERSGRILRRPPKLRSETSGALF